MMMDNLKRSLILLQECLSDLIFTTKTEITKELEFSGKKEEQLLRPHLHHQTMATGRQLFLVVMFHFDQIK